MLNTLETIPQQKNLEQPEPLGLDLKSIEVRDRISAIMRDGKIRIPVEIEILSSVELAPWLFHVLISTESIRKGEERPVFYAVLDEPMATIHTEQNKYCLELIQTLLKS